ncbi:hypothetical protein LguiB_010203 [Lonicera macranthoides]
MVQRLTYRKRHSYATKSNQNRVVKTPGGKLVYQTTKKRASGPKCPVTGKRIQGSLLGYEVLMWHIGPQQSHVRTSVEIPHLRPAEYKRSRLSRNRRTVNRAYGGVLSGSAVRERYVDHQSIPGGRAENCEKGSEDPKGKGKGSLKELIEGAVKEMLFVWMIISYHKVERNFGF